MSVVDVCNSRFYLQFDLGLKGGLAESIFRGRKVFKARNLFAFRDASHFLSNKDVKRLLIDTIRQLFTDENINLDKSHRFTIELKTPCGYSMSDTRVNYPDDILELADNGRYYISSSATEFEAKLTNLVTIEIRFVQHAQENTFDAIITEIFAGPDCSQNEQDFVFFKPSHKGELPSGSKKRRSSKRSARMMGRK